MPRVGYRAPLAVVGAALFLSACHNYVPVEDPAPGSTARVRVPVRSALDGPNEAPQTLSIEGKVVSFGDSLRLEVTSRVVYGAYRELMQVDTLSLARDAMSSLELRSFSTGRTIALTAVITGGTALLAARAIGLTGGSQGGGPGGGPPIPGQLSVVPVLKTVWRLAGG